MRVDLVRFVPIVLFAGINGAPLAVPNTQATFIHPLSLLLIASLQPMFLLVGAGVRLRGFGEPE